MVRLTAFLLALCAAAASACAQGPELDPTHPDAVVAYGGPEPLIIETAEGAVEFSVEIAETAEARQRGLMHRESLSDDAGMLLNFQFVQPVSIFMRNTLIPLDILYIREDGTIAKIVMNAQPLSERSLVSDAPVLAVLEINGGLSAELGIEPGDLVRHRLFGAAETAGDAASGADAAQPEGEGGEGEPEAPEPEAAVPDAAAPAAEPEPVD